MSSSLGEETDSFFKTGARRMGLGTMLLQKQIEVSFRSSVVGNRHSTEAEKEYTWSSHAS